MKTNSIKGYKNQRKVLELTKSEQNEVTLVPTNILQEFENRTTISLRQGCQFQGGYQEIQVDIKESYKCQLLESDF